VHPSVIEELFSGDFAFLQDLYVRVNDHGAHLIDNFVETQCPTCGGRFTLDLTAAR
jgi:hypothetical protein